MPPVVVRRITTAPRLVYSLLKSMMTGTRVFRGESDAGWTLRPSAWRDSRPFRSLLTFLAPDGSTEWCTRLPDNKLSPEEQAQKYLGRSDAEAITRIRLLTGNLLAERFIVGSFAGACDRVALPTPGIDEQLSLPAITDSSIVNRTRENGAPILRKVPTLKITQTYAFAQHHGMPTRLVDFSENPLKAAFFAAEKSASVPNLFNFPLPDFAIWIATPPENTIEAIVERAMSGSDAEAYYVLRSKIPYLHAQDGLFVMCNASGNAHFLDHGSWPSIDTLLHGWQLEKIVCPYTIAGSVISILDRMGVSRETLKPSYTEVASTVLRRLL